MPDYDLHSLSPYEFQDLCCALLRPVLGQRIITFPEGPDGGMDGLCKTQNGDIIIQCKRFTNGSFTGLKAALRNSDLKQVKAHKPHRYILAVSLSLTHKQRQELTALFQPCLDYDDIFDHSDLCALLFERPDLKALYLKLFITDCSELMDIIHQGITEFTRTKLTEAKKQLQSFALTSFYRQALEILNKHRVILLTGIAGIGKTETARQLLLASVAEGYRPVVISENIREAISVYSPNIRSVFFFDDFLGSIKPGGPADCHHTTVEKITDFIKMVLKDGRSRVILTSRTNILVHSSFFFRSQLEQALGEQFTLRIEKLTIRDRALILYSLLAGSEIPAAVLRTFISRRFFLKVIKHEAFNPRLISIIIERGVRGDISSSALPAPHSDQSAAGFTQDFILHYLQHPDEVYRDPFLLQLDRQDQLIVKLIMANGGEIDISTLETSYSIYREQHPQSENSDLTLKERLMLLENSFVRSELRDMSSDLDEVPDPDSQVLFYLHYNPSVSDFMLPRLLGAEHDYLQYLRCLQSRDAALFLAGLQKQYPKQVRSLSAKLLSDLTWLREQDDQSFDVLSILLTLTEPRARCTLLKGRLRSILSDFTSWLNEHHTQHPSYAARSFSILLEEGIPFEIEQVFNTLLSYADSIPDFHYLALLAQAAAEQISARSHEHLQSSLMRLLWLDIHPLVDLFIDECAEIYEEPRPRENDNLPARISCGYRNIDYDRLALLISQELEQSSLPVSTECIKNILRESMLEEFLSFELEELGPSSPSADKNFIDDLIPRFEELLSLQTL